MKRLRGGDASLPQGYSRAKLFIRLPWQFATPIYIPGLKRGTVRVKCFVEEGNTLIRPGLESGPLNPEISDLTIRPVHLPHIKYILQFSCMLFNENIFLNSFTVTGGWQLQF